MSFAQELQMMHKASSYKEGVEANKAQPGKDQVPDEKFLQHMQCGQENTTKMSVPRTLMYPCILTGCDMDPQLHDTDVPE